MPEYKQCSDFLKIHMPCKWLTGLGHSNFSYFCIVDVQLKQLYCLTIKVMDGVSQPITCKMPNLSLYRSFDQLSCI